MDLFAVIGDGSLIKFAVVAIVAFLGGWLVPADKFPFLGKYLGPKN